MKRQLHIFYNSVTGEIYYGRMLTHQQAENNCGVNRNINMMCKPESEINGNFFSARTQAYDIENNAFIAKTLHKPRACDFVKQQRDIRLLKSDWTQGADSPLSDAKKAEWATYRQALRDLDYHSCSNANNIVWPTPPA